MMIEGCGRSIGKGRSMEMDCRSGQGSRDIQRYFIATIICS